MKKYLMAIDAGTGSVRAVLFDTEGNQVGCAQSEWEHKEDPSYPGSMDFDWDYNWQLASRCIRDVIEETQIDPSHIAGISTTCMREGIVLYDGDGKEIWACANVDSRSSDEVGQLIELNPTLEQELYATSGQTYALGALPRLLWVKNKLPDLYEKAATVSMFNDWLIYKLTGVLVTEPSNGCTTGIFDLATRTWDPSIATKCGIKSSIFPPVVECGSIVAPVNTLGATDTGLCEGIPVVAGGGDAQLGCIGVGVTQPNQAAVFGGSFWQYEYNTDKPSTDEHCRVRVNCHAVDQVWQFEALAFKPGMIMRWFRDAFCQLEKQQALETHQDPYEIMNEHAKAIPAGCYGMMCTFSDVMNYINWKHASPTFTNFDFNPDQFNKYTFYRAIMENTALVTLGHLNLVSETTGNTPTEIIFAGGASKSSLWCQIVADVLGLPVNVPVVKEATALGAAILAGKGVGLYDDLNTAAHALVRIESRYEPNEANHKIYSEIYKTWRTVYTAQLDLSDSKMTRYMWCAPGL